MSQLRARRFTKKKCRSYTYCWSKEGRTIRGLANLKVIKFEVGNRSMQNKFKKCLELIVLKSGNILENALEALRLKCVKRCQALFGKKYYAKIICYPHHVFREHRQAKADRISSGMRRPFGVPRIRAARVLANQKILKIYHDSLKHTPKQIGVYFKTLKAQLPLKSKILVRSGAIM